MMIGYISVSRILATARIDETGLYRLLWVYRLIYSKENNGEEYLHFTYIFVAVA